MEQREHGGCCIDRYGPKVDRIMSRFRPIAPKPAASSLYLALPGGVTAFPIDPARFSRARRRCRRRAETVASLTLGPYVRQAPPAVAVALARPVWFVESFVMVKSISETCARAVGLGMSTEEEARRAMESDGMPGFVSAPGGAVVWTNEAYRKMVGGGGGEGVVVLLMGWKAEKEEEGKVLACRVKLEWSGGKVTMPANVWRVAGGSLAWRLDVNTALSLGR